MADKKMTEPEKWQGMNKMYAELDKELKREYADVPDTPVTRRLLADIARLKRENFNNWMIRNHGREVPDDIRWPDLDDEI